MFMLTPLVTIPFRLPVFDSLKIFTAFLEFACGLIFLTNGQVILFVHPLCDLSVSFTGSQSPSAFRCLHKVCQ